MSMTRTPDIKRVNGVHPMSRDRKNHVVFSRKRRWCLRFSWITEVLCIMISFQKARPSTRRIIWALWDVCVKQFAKKDWICGQTTLGFWTTISHPRTAIVIREHLAKNETNTIQQPSNSPDLAPCDFLLFGRLKKPRRGTRYSIRDEVMEKSKMALMAIPQTDHKKCFEDWINRWHKCVAVDGEYFEGDNIDYDE